MTAVRLRESAGYGARLYAYLLGVTLLGGAGLGLGVALAWSEVGAVVGSGGADTTELAAGGILVLLGLTVLSIGYLSAGYKLIADAVAAGGQRSGEAGTATAADAVETAPVAGSTGPADGGVADGRDAGSSSVDRPAEVEAEARTAPGVDPQSDASPSDAPESRADGEFGSRAETDEARVEASHEEYGSRQTEGPPEPTPEEIAFGPSGEDEGETVDSGDEEAEESVDDPGEERSSGSVRPAGRNAPSDPLADPTDDE